MNKFLKVSGAISFAGLLISIALGYMVVGGDGLEEHAITGFLAALFAIMTLVVIMFYFIATGATVREGAEKGVISVEQYNKTRKFKAKIFPWIMIAMVALIALPALGAAVDTGKAPEWIHGVFAIGTCVLYLVTLILSAPKIRENRAICEEVISGVEEV